MALVASPFTSRDAVSRRSRARARRYIACNRAAIDARSGDGTAAQFSPAIASAVYYASLNSADQQKVAVPAGNVVLGNWSFTSRTFTPYGGTMAAYRVNAVQVTAPSLSVSTWFAPIIGVTSESVQTTAIAVGGSPAQTCGFPLAVPDCFNRDQSVVGYVEMKLVSASSGPPRTITVSVDCTRTGSQAPNGSGGFFGYKSTNVYLVK